MKKINLLLSITILATGVTAIATSRGFKTPIEAEASRAYHTTGFYERVNDINRLENGDKVLICIYNSEVLSRFGGNPASAIFETSGVYFTSDKKFVALDDSPATEFTLIYDSDNHYYQFRGTMEMDSTNTYDVLLGHAPYDESTGFPNIGYFTGGDRFGARVYNEDNLNDSKTKFTLSYSGNSDGENITLTNCYTSVCARSYSIYRKAVSKSFYGNNYDDLYKNYYIGDDLKLNGFCLDVMDGIYGSDDTEIYYDDNPDLFYFTGDGKAKSGQTQYDVKVHGITGTGSTFTFEINEPETNPNHKFNYVTPTMLKDYRGTYLAVEQEGGTRIFNGRVPSFDFNKSNSTEVTISDSQLNASSRYIIDQAIVIEKVSLNGQMVYVAQTTDLWPRYYNNPYYNDNNPDAVFLELTDTVSESNVISIEENPNGGMTFGFKNYNGSKFFGFSYANYEKHFFFETVDRYQNARLYKLDSNDYFDRDIQAFISEFEEQTKNCDATGNSRTVFDHHWARIENEFNTLTADTKGYLANLTYTHNAEAAHSIQNIIDRYDFLLSKYSDLKDFIGRKEVLTWQNNSNSPVINNELLTNTTTSIAMVMVCAMSFVLFGLLLVYKKKKAN